jgi:hypothetical protein
MQTAEPLIPELSLYDIETERYKLPGTAQIQVQVKQAKGNMLCSEIRAVINSIWSKEILPQQWNKSINIPAYEKGDKTEYSNYRRDTIVTK